MKIKVQVGTRTGDSRLSQHRIPIDVVTADEIRRSGYSDLPKILNHLLANFTYDFSTIDDLTDHVRPFSLNGLKADQTLVLINGKRVHQGAVIDVNDSQNSGSATVDLSLIPIEAIQRIEVLRDDGSAQYGTDAIAGVINVVLKDERAHEVLLTSGRRKAGDGTLVAANYNYGDAAFFGNIEVKRKDFSNTSDLDRRDYYFEGDPRNGAYRVTHRYGDPEARSASATINAHHLLDHPRLYAMGKVVYKESEATGFFRRPNDDRNVRVIHPDGFLPVLAPMQKDILATIGYKTEAERSSFDIANTYGSNQVDIRVKNSVNASLGLESPTEFDAGSLSFWQNTLNFNATFTPDPGSDRPIALAYGFELRHEEARIKAGEWASWVDGLTPILDGPNAGGDTVGGAQLYPGFAPTNANHVSREVLGFYGEASRRLLDQLNGSLSVRDEHYSDFGNTLQGKVALSYALQPAWVLRASVSSGYRAPSLQQMSYYRTATSYKVETDGSLYVAENGVFPTDNPLAKLLGAQALRPEESIHASLGATWQPFSHVQLSADAFQIKLRDRIILSSDIYNSASLPTDAQEYMTTHSIEFARYFMNGADTTTRGFDLSGRYEVPWEGRKLSLQAQYHAQHSTLDRIDIPGQIAAIRDQVLRRNDRERLLRYLPEHKALLAVQYQWGLWDLFTKVNYFGRFLYVEDSDDRRLDQWFGARTSLDMDLSYRLQPITWAIGGHNITDVRPEFRRNAPPYNGKGNIFPYRGISPMDYTGAYYYLRLQLTL